MIKLLNTSPAQGSSRAATFLQCPETYMNDWWMAGSGEITVLNIELLQVAYSALELKHPRLPTSTPTISTNSIIGGNRIAGGGSCSTCKESRAIAHHVVVTLKYCAVHIDATHQFTEWSTGQSQCLIWACWQLCLEQ